MNISEYEHTHVSGYTGYTEISTLERVYRNIQIHCIRKTRVDARCLHSKNCRYKNILILVYGA